MSPLRGEPPGTVASMDELFALAHRLETEAAARYERLAVAMGTRELPAVAAAFRELAEGKRRHAAAVEGWCRGVTGTLPDPARLRWQPPDAIDEEEAQEIASSRLASAYRAWSIAVRNEERTFALWAYIAAQAETPAVRGAAERVAGGALQHAALVRQARRRAYHAERGRAHHPTSGSAPLARAVRAEAQLARLLPRMAEGAPIPEAAELRRQGAAAAEAARALAGPDIAVRADMPEQDALRLAEQAADAYLDAAEAARDEEQVRRLQSRAGTAIARVAILRRALGGL